MTTKFKTTPKRVLAKEFEEANGTDVGAALLALVFGFIAMLVTAVGAARVAQGFFWVVTAGFVLVAVRARRTVHRWRDQERERLDLEEAEKIIDKDTRETP